MSQVQRLRIGAAAGAEIANKREEPGELVAGIDVVLDNVIDEVVRAGETPNGDQQQSGDLVMGQVEIISFFAGLFHIPGSGREWREDRSHRRCMRRSSEYSCDSAAR